MTENSTLNIKQIECTGCGAKINIHTGLRMKTFVCEYCGSVCENDQVVAVQHQKEIKEKYAPQRYLKLGLKGNFLGREYQIVGRIRYEASDDEDTWMWDEWFLMSPTGYPIWLQEDETGFTLMRKYVPAVWIDYLNNSVFLRDGDVVLEYIEKERSTSKILFLEGELTWKAIPSETSSYADYQDDEHRLLSIEYSKNEIQYYKGIKLTDQDMLAAFPDIAQLSDNTNAENNETTKKQHQGISWFFVAGVAFIVGLLSLYLNSKLQNTGASIVDTIVTLPVTSKQQKTDFNQTFKLKKNSLVSIILESDEFPYGIDKSETAWMLSLELYRKASNGKRKKVEVINTDFWIATGYDSDGVWSDAKLDDKKLIKLKKGTYEVSFVYAAVQNNGKNYSYNNKLKLKIKQGVWYPKPFSIFGWLLLIPSGLFWLIQIFKNWNAIFG